MNSLLVGIDAGGTGIRVGIAPAGSPETASIVEVAAAGDGGPEPLRALSDERLPAAASVRSVCAGIAKHSRGDLPERWRGALTQRFPSAVVVIVPDFAIAFRGALPEGVGIGAIAGTGSIVYGQSPAGASVRVGGHGWEFGDEGSGAWLTAEAVRRTVRAADGMQPRTPLMGRVFEELVGAASMDDAGAASRAAAAARTRAASEGRGFLVPLLAAAAAEGETEARDLFVGAAGWLGAFVRKAAARIALAEEAEPIAVAMIGGLWNVGEPLSGPFASVLDRFARRDGGPGYRPVMPHAPPVIGALRMASEAPPVSR